MRIVCRSLLAAAAAKMAKVFVDEEIKKAAVVFSKSYCPFCKMAKSVLDEVGAKYTVHELDERGEGVGPRLTVGVSVHNLLLSLCR